jgi:hypothetical protein
LPRAHRSRRPHKVIVTGRGQTSATGPYDRCILLLELTLQYDRDADSRTRRVTIIVKTNDDVRQEQLAMELLSAPARFAALRIALHYHSSNS